MTPGHEYRLTNLELTVATLVSENHAVHERVYDRAARMDARVDSIVGRIDRTSEAVNEWKVELAKEVESFRRLVVDLRRHADANALELHRRCDLLEVGLEGTREDCGL